MSGWPPGTTINVWMSSGLFEGDREGVVRPLEQLPEATLGLLRARVRLVDDPDPTPRTGEITVASFTPNAAELGCPTGCAIPVQVVGGFLQAVRIVVPGPPSPGEGLGYAHEIGHAAFGFCHINGYSEAGTRTIMGFVGTRLTDDDLAAARAVYGAGLHGGSPRAAFVAAGLINP